MQIHLISKLIYIFAVSFLAIAAQAQDTPSIINFESPERVPGQFIIMLREGVNAQDKLEQLRSAKLLPEDAEVVFYELINGFTVTSSEEFIRHLISDKDIELIEAATLIQAYQ